MIVDFQGFKYGKDGKFVMKELAAVCQNDGRHTYFLFKPPKPFKELSRQQQVQYRWLERNYLRGIKWSDGYTDLSMLPALLLKLVTNVINHRDDNVYILCKGSEKKSILQSQLELNNITATIIDLDDYQAYLPNITSLSGMQRSSDIPTCLFHNHLQAHCALRNVWDLYYKLTDYDLSTILYE